MPCRLCSLGCFANPPCEAGVRSSLASCPANPSERTCRVRRAASQTWRVAMPCSSSRPSNPASEPDVLAEAPRESRRAAVPCEPLLRIPASESVLRVEPLREAALRAAPNVRRRQDFAVVRSWAAIRGNFSPWCVPGRQSVAIFSLHASLKGPRTGKAPLPGNISPPCIQNELALARFARHVSEKRCKSPFGNA